MRALFLLALCSFAAPAADTPYTIETFAGTSWAGDGKPALEAVLVQPAGIAVDPYGNVWIADSGDHRIRRVGLDGIIRTVAGTGSPGRRADQLNCPYGIALDAASNLYIADLGNAMVRRLGSDGRLTTIAGGGQERPVPGKVIKAADARLIKPRDVAVDRFGNVFIADFEAHMVYQVNPAGMLVVVAGTGKEGPSVPVVLTAQSELSHPAGLAIDAAGVLYIADSGNSRVRRLEQGFLMTVKGKTGQEVSFWTPTGLAFDAMGRLYVVDGGGSTSVLGRTGEYSGISIAGISLAIGRGSEVFTASGRQVLRLTGATPEDFAGSKSGPGAGDGWNRQEWRFTAPSAMVRDNLGYLYIADTGNGRIRRLSPAGELTTITTHLAEPVSLAFDSKWRLHAGDRATGAVFLVDALGNTEAVASENRRMNPAALAFDQNDNLLIADAENQVIRKVTSGGGSIVLAGGGPQLTDGPALFGRLLGPAGLAVDDRGDIWFTESGSGRLRRLSDGQLTTVLEKDLKEPRGLRFADGALVVADCGLNRIVRVLPSGEWVPLAGTGDQGFAGDNGPALSAILNAPSDLVPLPDGSILVVDSFNNRIRLLKPDAAPRAPARRGDPCGRGGPCGHAAEPGGGARTDRHPAKALVCRRSAGHDRGYRGGDPRSCRGAAQGADSLDRARRASGTRGQRRSPGDTDRLGTSAGIICGRWRHGPGPRDERNGRAKLDGGPGGARFPRHVVSHRGRTARD